VIVTAPAGPLHWVGQVPPGQTQSWSRFADDGAWASANPHAIMLNKAAVANDRIIAFPHARQFAKIISFRAMIAIASVCVDYLNWKKS
jgi:hypothetical protein